MQYLIVRCTLLQSLSEPLRFATMLHDSSQMHRRNISGLSLLSGSTILHYLEGPSDAIAAVGAALQQDNLYRDIRVVAQGSLDRRRCASWQMAYATSRPTAHPAFSRLLSDRGAQWPPALQEAPELAVLRSFRSGALDRPQTAPLQA